MLAPVTSVLAWVALSRSLLVKGGRARLDETVFAPLADGRVVSAQVTRPVFYDREGERQNV